MDIRVQNTQDDGALGFAKYVSIISFRQVTIFGKDYTKIVYRHSPTDYSVEKVGKDVDYDENVQVISGPEAEGIITCLIETEKLRGSTFLWTGVRYRNTHCKNDVSDDPMLTDPVECEEERRKSRQKNQNFEVYNND